MERRTMNLKTYLLSIGALSLAASLMVNAAEEHPNIILILSDDISSKDLACYGGYIKTPTLTRLADKGVLFQTAWSAPLCGPSRAILHTGKYPYNQGYYENGVTPTPSFTRDKRHQPILRMAKAAGYATGMYGKVHHDRGEDASIYGMDDYCLWQKWDGHDGPYARYWHPSYVANGKGVPTCADDFGPDIALQRIFNFIDVNKETPFFVYWPAVLAHGELSPETNRWGMPEVPEVNAAGKKTGGRVKGSLKSMIEYQDYLVGQLVEKLEKLGLMENTIIFYIGDNGTPGYGKGKYNNEVALRVPFVVSGGPVKAIGSSDVLIDFTDIWPTLADLMGYAGPDNTDGHSFAPYLLGEPFTPRSTIQMAMNNARWLRNENWLLDGYGHFWDCRGTRDESKYKDVTQSHDPEVMAARRQFEKELKKIPLPDYEDPKTKKSWQRFRKKNPPVKVFRPDYLDREVK